MNPVRHLGWFLLAGWTATSLLAAEPPLGCTDAEVSQPSAEPEARWISWVETFGDCMLYAGAFRRQADGSYEAYATEAALPRLVRTAWSWESGSARPDDMLCWVGLHDCVNNDAHVPFRAVVDWKLGPPSLAGLRTLVIPDARWLDDQVLSVLEGWVSAGGRLVITGASGTRRGTDGLFARRTASLLAPLAGRDILENDGTQAVHRRNVGKGMVIWAPY